MVSPMTRRFIIPTVLAISAVAIVILVTRVLPPARQSESVLGDVHRPAAPLESLLDPAAAAYLATMIDRAEAGGTDLDARRDLALAYQANGVDDLAAIEQKGIQPDFILPEVGILWTKRPAAAL